jgi:hypothetical protein
MLITRDAFIATFAEPMREVLDPEATALVDSIVSRDAYLNAIPESHLQGYALPIFSASRIYESGDSRHAHVLYPTTDANAFLVLVVSLPTHAITGHYFLDLNIEYGLVPSDQ